MQITFAPGATDWRIGGSSLYSDALPSLTELTNLFDQYRINKVYLQIDYPMGNSNSYANPQINPLVYYVTDYDDPNDASLSDLLQYPQLQQHNFWRGGYTPLLMSFSPKPLRDIAGSGIGTGYGPMTYAPWIRTADTIVPHYGLKMTHDFFGITQANSIKFKVTVWYDMSFTNPK